MKELAILFLLTLIALGVVVLMQNSLEKRCEARGGRLAGFGSSSFCADPALLK